MGESSQFQEKGNGIERENIEDAYAKRQVEGAKCQDCYGGSGGMRPEFCFLRTQMVQYGAI